METELTLRDTMHRLLRLPADVVTLLNVDHLRGKRFHDRRNFAAVVIGFLNLFFCAYFEQLIKDDPTGEYLLLLLFLESSWYFFLSLVHFQSDIRLTLSRVTVFPILPVTRFRFTVASNILNPVLGALWLSNILFFLILNSFSIPMMVISVVVVVLWLVTVVCSCAVLFLNMQRIQQSLEALAVLSVLSAFIVLFLSLVFEAETMLRIMPIISWTGNILVWAQQAEWLRAGGYCLASVMFFMLILFLGKRYA